MGDRSDPAGGADLAELAALNRRLERTIDAQDRMLAAATHEMASPIATISMYISLIDELSPAELQEAKEAVERQVQQLRRLVADLRDFSSTGTGRLGLQLAAVDLNQAVAEVVADSGAEGIEVRPAEPRTVHADADRVRQAVANLVTDAVRHGAPPIVIEVGGSQDWATVAVSDGGAGVDDEHLPTLFEPFGSAHRAARAAGREGSGLGLSIVRTLARAHGGDVTYDRPDGGSRFVLTLPGTAAAMAEGLAARHQDEGRVDPPTVLVVGGGEDLRADAGAAARDMGFAALEAAADDALAALSAGRPELIVVEVADAPGTAAAPPAVVELVERARREAIPVLAVLGADVAADAVAGADIARRPMTGSALRGRVQALLSQALWTSELRQGTAEVRRRAAGFGAGAPQLALDERVFADAIDRISSFARRRSEVLAVLTVGVDGGGPPPGIDVASSIARTLRAEDVLGRRADAYVVVLPGTDLAGAITVAERIRAAVAHDAARLGSAATVSVGAHASLDLTAALSESYRNLFVAMATGGARTLPAVR